MTKKSSKFDLTKLVKEGMLKDGQKVCFVSDPSRACVVWCHPSGEYKLKQGEKVLTVHQFATECLQTEPPGHATRWVRTDEGGDKGKTLYELWQGEDVAQAA